MRKVRVIISVGVALFLGGRARGALLFHITTPVGTDPVVVAALNNAAGRWGSYFGDNVTVNLNVSFAKLGAGAIANTSPAMVNVDYSTVRDAMVADATSGDDVSAVGHLPAGDSFNFLTNDFATGNVVLDNDGSSDNSILRISRANAKALGIVNGNSATVDATIQFNSNLTTSTGTPVPFDYDPSDGIDANSVDFTGVATHEMGHALGFLTGVDAVDFDSKPNGAGVSFNDSVLFTPLDLFRYSADSALLGVNDESTTGSIYFSVDGGATDLGLFSTGVKNGDGFQPEHWKHLSGEGIMDPTFALGQARDIEPLDVRAMDVIGYTLVPEPSAVMLIAVLASGAVFRRQHKQI